MYIKLNINKILNKKRKALSLYVSMMIILSLSVISAMYLTSNNSSMKNIDQYNLKLLTYQTAENTVLNSLYTWNINPIYDLSSTNFPLNYGGNNNIVSLTNAGEVLINDVVGADISLDATENNNKRLAFKMKTKGEIPNSKIKTFIEAIILYKIQ